MHTDRCGNTGRQNFRAKGSGKVEYKRLVTELQRMWNLKSTIIPVTIGATVIAIKT
jgi:hypothetical protein